MVDLSLSKSVNLYNINGHLCFKTKKIFKHFLN